MPINCFTNHGMPELHDKLQAMVANGMNEYEAARKLIIEESEKLHDGLNKVRKKAYPSKPPMKLEKQKEPDLNAIHEAYDKKIEESKANLNPSEVKNTGGEIEPPSNTVETVEEKGGTPSVSIHHEGLTKLATKLNLHTPERGDYVSPEQYVERGRLFLKNGASVDEIYNKTNELHDRISIGRAYLEKYLSELNDIRNEKGENSQEYKDKLGQIDDLKLKIKSLGSKAGQSMTSLQDPKDMGTDKFEVLRDAFEEQVGGKPNKEQAKKIDELTKKNKELKQQFEELQKKLIEETDRSIGGKDEQGKYEKSYKKAADVFRKLKQKPFTFKDENGNEYDISKMGIGWNDLVEAGAKIIEKTGQIIDGINHIIDKVKDLDWYIKLSDKDKDAFEKKLHEYYQSENNLSAEEKIEYDNKRLEEVQNMFADKTKNNFSPEESKFLWDYAKEKYLSNGISYPDTIIKLSDDTGLSIEQVHKALTTSKVKPISDAMWKKKNQIDREKVAVEGWIESQKTWKPIRLIKSIPSAFRGVTVFGHGGIFVGTHAAPNLFNSETFKPTLKAFINGWKFAYGNEAKYTRQMEDLKNSRNYTLAQRAGLKNNPDNINLEEFQSSQKYMGKFGHAGEKGFNAIKVLRQNMFDYEYGKLSEEEKQDPEIVKTIAHLINLSTGATNSKIPKQVNEYLFAGGMELSRWTRLFKNPSKASSIALKAITGSNVSPSEKIFAKVWSRRVGKQIGIYSSLLAANAVIQSQLNPHNPVNLTNPQKPDWLKFKFGDLTIDPTSGMRGLLDFVADIGTAAVRPQKELRGDTRMEAEAKRGGSYLRGKLAPFYSVVADAITGTDFYGNVLPWNSDKPRTGKRHLTFLEYALQRAPLPVAEAAHEIYESAYNESGDKPMIKNVLGAFLTAGISGGTGFRASEYEPKKDSYSKEQLNNPVIKFFTEKLGMELPATDLENETLTNEENSTKIKVSSLPKEKQEKYNKLHFSKLKEKLAEIRSNAIVYVKEYKKDDGTIEKSVSLKDNGGKVKSLTKLDENEKAQVLSLAQKWATSETKKEFEH